MKLLTLVLMTVSLLFLGCEFSAPLTAEHGIAIDRGLLGRWEPKPPDGEEGREGDQQMLILEYSATEYLIHYPTGEQGIYYRAYPVEIGGVPCVQLQVIGTSAGPVARQETKRFHVASYQMTGSELEIKTLNPQLFDEDVKTPGELRAAFLSHKDDAKLFVKPAMFRRVRK